jgi:hypothetical protein
MKKILATFLAALFLSIFFITPGISGTISIGADATDRNSGGGFNGETVVCLANPANAPGVLNTIEVYTIDTISLKIGVFYGSAGNFTCRSVANIGSVTGGSKQTFTGLNLAVQAGDYIGYYQDAGTPGSIEISTTGSGYYHKSGDYTSSPMASGTYTANQDISLHGNGIGITLSNALFFNQ